MGACLARIDERNHDINAVVTLDRGGAMRRAAEAGSAREREAAAVACGMSFFDVGNDLMGSVRIPAPFCGVCGFVPSFGVMPRTGLVPEQPTSESVRQLPRIGVLTRSAADALLAARVGVPMEATPTPRPSGSRSGFRRI